METLKKYKKKIFITFWLGWALFFISTLFVSEFSLVSEMLGLYLIMITYFGFPIVGLILMAIFQKKPPQKVIKESTPAKTEAEIQAEKEREEKEKMMAEEKARIKNRQGIEKYSFATIGISWIIIPILLFFILGFFLIKGLMNDSLNWYLLLGVVLCTSPMVTSNIESNWGKRLNCKKELAEDEPGLDISQYDYFRVYTDSKFDYYLYKASKIACYLITIATLGFLISLGFLWLSEVTIAPTTVIIVLLIIIIINQNKGRIL